MPNNVRIHTQVDGNAGKELHGLRDTWKAFQAEGSSGLKIAAGVTAGAAAFSLLDRAASVGIEAIEGSIHAASDLNETMTKSEVIFGNNSDAVAKWAEGMDSAAGQSKKAALDAASGFAGLFKTVGLGIDQSTDMAKGLTQLGSDLASFFNTDVEDALGALKSGLNGEAEPLRRFNVFLSESAVSAKLAEMGIKKTGGAFTEAQKATARYALIMEQTGDAQGDFARTSDGLANKQRILNAEMDNLAARAGNVLLPAVVSLTGAFVDMAEAVDKATDASTPTEDRLKSLSDVLTSLNPLAWSTSGAFDGFSDAQKREADAAAAAAAETAGAWDTGSERVGAALGAMADDSADTTRQMKADQRAIRWDFKKTANYLLDDYNTEVDKAMGIEEARSALSVLRHEAAVDAKALASGKLTAKEKHEAAKREKIRDQESADEYEKLAELGALSQKDYAAWLKVLERLAKSTKGKVHDAYVAAIADIRRLQGAANANIDVNVSYSSQGSKANTHGRAAGGPVAPYQAVTWQEHGGEKLAMGAAGGRVFPSDGGSGSGGSPIVVNLNVSTPLLTPGAADAVAQAIGPVITKWQQDRRLLARA